MTVGEHHLIIVNCQLIVNCFIMLQRIQTVYLLIIVALTIAILFLPLAVLQSGDQLFTFDATGISTMAAQPELIYPMGTVCFGNRDLFAGSFDYLPV